MNEVRAALATLAGFLLAGCMSPSPSTAHAGHIERPVLTQGDYWEYTTDEGHSIRREVLSAGEETLRGEAYYRYTIREGNHTFDEIYRKSDGAEAIYDRHVLGANVSISGYDPPCMDFFGTHAVGSTWTSSCFWYWHVIDESGRTHVLGEQWDNRTFTLLGVESKTGSFGSTSVLHIREIAIEADGQPREASDYDIWYSPELCREVGSEFHKSFTEGDLVRASCAKGSQSAR